MRRIGLHPLLRVAVWSAVAIASWLAADATDLDTRVEVVCDGSRVLLTVEGTTVEAPVRLSRISRVVIVARDGVFPPGGHRLEVSRDGHTLVSDRLPARFKSPRGRIEPVGDWFLDQQISHHEVWRRELQAASPFTVRTSFSGRVLQHLTLRLKGDRSTDFRFRRGLINNDLSIATGRGETLVVESLEPRPRQRLLAVASTITRATSLACALVAIALIAAWLGRSLRPSPDRFTGVLSMALPISLFLAVLSVGLSVMVAGMLLDGLPHVPDSVAYLLQAKWMLDGSLYQPLPAVWEHLNVPMTFHGVDRWISQYPVVWPAMLAVGEAVDLPWLVSPLLRGLYTLLIFLVGRQLYGRGVGLAATLLAVVSPMASLMFSSMMSHAAAATLILLGLWLWLVATRGAGLAPAALGGLSLGLAFGMRPLTAVAVAAALGLYMLNGLWTTSERLRRLGLMAAFAAGGVMGTLPTLLGNAIITGSATTFPYQLVYRGVWGADNLALGIRNLDTILASTLPALHGWGWLLSMEWLFLPLALSFCLLPFLLRRSDRHDVLLAGIFLAVTLAHLGSQWHGLHGYGPRYYFEAFFGLYLLTARGFFELGRVSAAGDGRPARAAAVMAAALGGGLVLSSAITLPARLLLYRDYNYVDSRLLEELRVQGIDRGLVLLADSRWFEWARAVRRMEADPDADLVFAARKQDPTQVLERYPDRPVYLWQGARLEPYDPGAEPAEAPTEDEPS